MNAFEAYIHLQINEMRKILKKGEVKLEFNWGDSEEVSIKIIDEDDFSYEASVDKKLLVDSNQQHQYRRLVEVDLMWGLQNVP